MPRTRTHRQNPTANSVIASAANLTRERAARGTQTTRSAQPWQKQAWDFFDTVGEFRYGVSWKAQACSRAVLKITEDTPDGEVDVDSGPEVDALNIFAGGPSQHAAILSRMALHLNVPGETNIVGEPGVGPGGSDVWEVYSPDEISEQQGQWTVDQGDGKRPLVEKASVIRVWRPHPKMYALADSPARGLLGPLSILEGLTKHQGATIDSRLAGNGIFLVPSEMSLPDDPELAAKYPSMDPLMALLIDTMTTAIQQPDSAAAVAPIVLKVPGEYIAAAKHITFSTPFDERTQDLLDRNIRRIALGIDCPPEIVLGIGDVNHWGAWQADEAAIKTHVEPDLELITGGITSEWLQPAVEALGATVNPARRVNYDIAELRVRPDRSAQAVELGDRIVLSREAVRRENGFDEGDAPTPDEEKQMLLLKLAQSGTPDVAQQALEQLGIHIDLPANVPMGNPNGQAAPPGGNDPAVRALPQAASGVLASSELLVKRAVERANNRIHQRSRRKPIRPEQMGTALAGAWDDVPRAAELLGVDAAAWTTALDTYTRAVLAEGIDHVPAVLAKTLTAGSVLADA